MVLSEEMKRMIRGEVPGEEKRQAYKDSLHSWWTEYSHRKNDEDDMVADSLLYDERCHLPRTAPGPRFDEIATTDATPKQQQEEQQQQPQQQQEQPQQQ